MIGLKRVVLVLLALVMSGYVGLSADAAVGAVAAGKGRVALIGDSITAMGSSMNPGGYCLRLERAVAKDASAGELKFVHMGFGGYMLKTWMDLERKAHRGADGNVAAEFDRGFETIVIFLGMNDILRPTVTADTSSWDNWAADMKEFTASLRRRTGAKNFVYATITPLTDDPKSPKNVVREELNRRLRALAAEEGAAVASTGERAMKIIEESRKLNAEASFIPDLVHPNQIVHAALAAEIAKALGLEDAAARLDRDYESEFSAWAEKNAKKASWRLRSRPVEGRVRGTLVYEIEVYPNAATNFTVKTPKGIKVLDRTPEDVASGIVRVSGAFQDRVNPIEIVFDFADSAPHVERICLPAAWRVSSSFDAPDLWRGQAYLIKEDPHLSADLPLSSGRWLTSPFYVGYTLIRWNICSGTFDYSGKMNPGSVDPYQVVFGSQYDSLYAVRWVKSPEEREVLVRLGHDTFSATLAVNFWLNGEFFGTHLMDRNGGNRREFASCLRKGWNLIVARVDHANWQRQFSIELKAPDGSEMDDLKYSVFHQPVANNFKRNSK